MNELSHSISRLLDEVAAHTRRSACTEMVISTGSLSWLVLFTWGFCSLNGKIELDALLWAGFDFSTEILATEFATSQDLEGGSLLEAF